MAHRIEISAFVKKWMAARVVEMIRENTIEGRDRFGKPFKPYGTRPFARPLRGITKAAQSILKQSDGIIYFKKQERSTWVVIIGGYAALKAATYPGDNTVNLTARGSMLRSLRVLSVAGNVIKIGWGRQKEAEKAYWHTQSGAGKSRVIRDFLGLPDSDLARLKSMFEFPGAISVK